MHRWLKFEKGMFFELIEGGEVGWRFGPAEFLAGGEVENLATKAAVAQEGGDILVRGKTPMAELLPKKYGAFSAQGVVDGVGILDEGGLARIEREVIGQRGHGGLEDLLSSQVTGPRKTRPPVENGRRAMGSGCGIPVLTAI